MDAMLANPIQIPFLAVISGWPFIVAAQVGFFAVAIFASMFWPKTHPRWMTNEAIVLAPCEVLAALMVMVVILMTIGYAPFPR